ncbi:MAG: hypothetical protein V9E98_00970 [Candidatus Nanopelagicales bacterium]
MIGVGSLLRFDLSRDRVRVLLWVVLLGLMVIGVASSWDRLYPTSDERLQLVAILSGNPALTALLGPLNNPLSTGGLTAWRIGVGIVLVLGLVNIFTITRHVRGEEQSGRAEMLLAGRTSRVASLWAAVFVTLIAALAFVAIATGLMVAVGLAPAPSFLFAATAAASAWVFTGVSAVTNQITRSSRAANAIAASILVLTWAIAGLGNLQNNLLQWFSPFGWVNKADPFGGNHWEVLIVPLGATAILLVIATALQSRRDLAAGALADRIGPAEAGGALRGAHSLAWRLERSTLLWWVVGYLAVGAFIGASRDALIQFADSSPALTDIFEALGGPGAIIDAFLATYIGLGGVVAAFFAVSIVMRLDHEERAGHTSAALSTVTRRSRWLSAYVLLALVGSALILIALGGVIGLTFGLQGDSGLSEVPRLLQASLAWLPAIVLVVGLTVALIGLLPRWASAAWVIVAAFALITELGPVFALPSWLVNLSPFSHIAKVPAESLSAAPLIALTVSGLLLAMIGYIAFQVRDIRT